MENIKANWDAAFTEGYKLVIRAMRKGDDVEDDLRLGRLAAKALLIGIDADWISTVLERKNEKYLEDQIKKRTH